MAKTRAIRFSDEEARLIEEFLRKNPFFDFSSLTRLAITEFIKRPTIQIKGVQSDQKRRASKREYLKESER